jgi:hypothetical protein
MVPAGRILVADDNGALAAFEVVRERWIPFASPARVAGSGRAPRADTIGVFLALYDVDLLPGLARGQHFRKAVYDALDALEPGDELAFDDAPLRELSLGVGSQDGVDRLPVLVGVDVGVFDRAPVFAPCAGERDAHLNKVFAPAALGFNRVFGRHDRGERQPHGFQDGFGAATGVAFEDNSALVALLDRQRPLVVLVAGASRHVVAAVAFHPV